MPPAYSVRKCQGFDVQTFDVEWRDVLQRRDTVCSRIERGDCQRVRACQWRQRSYGRGGTAPALRSNSSRCRRRSDSRDSWTFRTDDPVRHSPRLRARCLRRRRRCAMLGFDERPELEIRADYDRRGRREPGPLRERVVRSARVVRGFSLVHDREDSLTHPDRCGRLRHLSRNVVDQSIEIGHVTRILPVSSPDGATCL
jgi:hypothetical protein